MRRGQGYARGCIRIIEGALDPGVGALLAAAGASGHSGCQVLWRAWGMGICVKPTANKVALTATGAATRARRGDMRCPVAKPEPHWHVAAFQLDPQQWQWL